MMYMDFKGMKFFNTKYGFAQGDKILKGFTDILVREFGNEKCCRVGADHFAAVAREAGLDGRLKRIFKEFEEIL